MSELSERLVQIYKSKGISPPALMQAMQRDAMQMAKEGESPDQAFARAFAGPNARLKHGPDLLAAYLSLEKQQNYGGGDATVATRPIDELDEDGDEDDRSVTDAGG